MKQKIIFFIFIFILFIKSSVGYEIEEVKVALIFKILGYVDWADLDVDSTFNIGVIGGGKIFKYLNNIPVNYTIKGKRVRVNKISLKTRNISRYKVIIISKESKINGKAIEKLVSKYKDILIISESIENFFNGVLITFFIKENEVKFKINFQSLADFTISFDETLLRYAYDY